jgi:hypothetical protein
MGDDCLAGPEDADAVPGVYTGPAGRPGPVLQTLDVNGEQFAARRCHDGGTHSDGVSGRNRDYGFSSSADPYQSDELHRQSIRGFLNMIDPETGYIAED